MSRTFLRVEARYSLPCGFQNLRDHAARVVEDVMIGHPEREHPIGCKHPITYGVLRAIMSGSIDLNNQPCSWTPEIHNPPKEWTLPMKAETRSGCSDHSQPFPESGFSVGGILSEALRKKNFFWRWCSNEPTKAFSPDCGAHVQRWPVRMKILIIYTKRKDVWVCNVCSNHNLMVPWKRI